MLVIDFSLSFDRVCSMTETLPRALEATYTLHKLRVFVEVAERQSVTLAARALFVTQPVVSSHIRDLEEFFGTPLFFRSGRRMVLTEAGRTVLEYAKELARSTAETMSAIKLQASGEAGRVLVGASETPGCYRLPEWLADFRIRHAAAEITMDVLGADEICERVRHGQYDFAVVAPIDPPRGLQVEVLFEEPLVLVCSPRHPLAHRAKIDRDAILQFPFISHCDRPRDWLEGRLRLFGLDDPRIALSVGSTEAVKLALRTGVGIAAMFRCSVERELSRGEFSEVDFQGASPGRAFFLVHAANKRFAPLQSRLIQYLRRRARGEKKAEQATGVIHENG